MDEWMDEISVNCLLIEWERERERERDLFIYI